MTAGTNGLVSFDDRDDPSEEFIERLRREYPTERETDELLVRKMRRRSDPPYRRITREELSECLHGLLDDRLDGPYSVSGESWFTGGVSKIQMGFSLEWDDPEEGRLKRRLVIRMDPSESMNITSRPREAELLGAFAGVIPVPRVYWLDRDAEFFPEPALIYDFVDGVTKPSATTTGQVSGLGTNFGPELRAKLAPQFMEHLAAIHTFDATAFGFETMDVPSIGSTEAALHQLNRARRTWEEDRGEDVPLMEVAANWLERNLPELDHVSVVHGDYRSGNFLFDEATGKVSAWLDWERGHLGDRHRDLAWTTQGTFGHWSEDGSVYYVCGLIPEHEFFDRYEEATGLSVDEDLLAFWRILNGYQILVVLAGSAYRVARLGKSHQDILLARMKGMTAAVADEMHALLRERI